MAREAQELRERVEGDGEERVEPQRGFQLPDGAREIGLGDQPLAQPHAVVGVARLELDGAPELPVGRFEVPVVAPEHERERCVRLGEIGIEGQSPLGLPLRLGVGLVRGYEEAVGLEAAADREAGVRRGEAGVARQGGGEVSTSEGESLGAPRQPGLARLEVGDVRLAVDGTAVLQARRLPGLDRHSDLVGHDPSDVALERESVAHLGGEAPTPTDRAVALDQQDRQPQRVAGP